MTTILKPLKSSDPVKYELKEAMKEVWQMRISDSGQLVARLKQKHSTLSQEKDNLVRSLSSNPSLADDIAESVAKIKKEIKEVDKKLSYASNTDDDFNAFVNFSLNYVGDLNAKWWNLTPDKRERCKQLTFPGVIFIDSNKRVSTPLLSAIYRYESMKKEPRKTLTYMNGGPS